MTQGGRSLCIFGTSNSALLGIPHESSFPQGMCYSERHTKNSEVSNSIAKQDTYSMTQGGCSLRIFCTPQDLLFRRNQLVNWHVLLVYKSIFPKQGCVRLLTDAYSTTQGGCLLHIFSTPNFLSFPRNLPSFKECTIQSVIPRAARYLTPQPSKILTV